MDWEMNRGLVMRRFTTNIKHVFLFSALAIAVSACSCDDKECKSSKDCKGGAVCRNGNCVIGEFPTSSDSGTTLGWDTTWGTGGGIGTTSTDSGVDTGTDTASGIGNTGSDSTTDTGEATDSDTTDDTMGTECVASWQCNDDNACTTEVCQLGGCIRSQTTPMPPGCCKTNSDCNDQNNCTADQCSAATYTCTHVPVSGSECCTSDLDCNDNNSCSRDACTLEGTCVHVANHDALGCCDSVNDCGSSSCAVLSCVNYQCAATFSSTLAEGCCVVDEDCPVDNGACTVATCNDRGECEYQTDPSSAEGCCMTDGDCDDGNSCNVDDCTYEYQCVHSAPLSPAAGCCLSDGDCADGNNCTVDACIDNVCIVETPDPLPAGCCDNAADCNDGNDCTRDICTSGRCYSAGDPTLGSDCCYTSDDCDDTNNCTTDVCDAFSSQCLHQAPDTDSMPVGCCLVNADCIDTDSPCSIGSCGPTPKYSCAFNTAADDTPCDNGLWCDGPEICSGGACVTRTDDVPCNGLDSICRIRDCSESTKDCSLIVEYDTDSACDDGLYCNGNDVCLAGDCVHRNAPCVGPDTDSLGACEEKSCNETSDNCEVANRPNFSSCENNLGCDGVNMCFEGICESSAYCGAGNDCEYYVCAEDTDGKIPSCTVQHYADGTSCQTPDLGDCYGSAGRTCLNGICSMGNDPMCTVTASNNGFCKEYYCIEAWGPGNFPSGGCGAATFNPTDTDVGTDSDATTSSFNMLGCASPADTDTTTDFNNTVVFTTALEHNKVSSYGATCSGTFNGGDLIYQMNLVQDQSISLTLSGIETTDTDTAGYDVHLMILPSACDATSCTNTASGTAIFSINNFIAPATGPYYIVIDTVDRIYATGTLTVTCNN